MPLAAVATQTLHAFNQAAQKRSYYLKPGTPVKSKLNKIIFFKLLNCKLKGITIININSTTTSATTTKNRNAMRIRLSAYRACCILSNF